MATSHLSLIIPVYNRPNEVEELLDSLTRQSETNFEVVIVEDGSKETCPVSYTHLTLPTSQQV